MITKTLPLLPNNTIAMPLFLIDILLNSIVNIADSVNTVNITVSETAEGINDIAEKTSELSTVVDDNESLVNTNKENTDKLDSVLSMFKH